ncbi:hypothetical protein D3C80_1994830 [compost metagenome]
MRGAIGRRLPLRFKSSKASAAEAQKMSAGTSAFSMTKRLALAVLRCTIVTRMSALARSKAARKGSKKEGG